jgi:hypothetical protein
MKASKAIEYLKELDPSEDIVLMYWARDLFNDYFDEDNQITKEAWDYVVEKLDNYDYLDGVSSNAHEIIEAELIKYKEER